MQYEPPLIHYITMDNEACGSCSSIYVCNLPLDVKIKISIFKKLRNKYKKSAIIRLQSLSCVNREGFIWYIRHNVQWGGEPLKLQQPLNSFKTSFGWKRNKQRKKMNRKKQKGQKYIFFFGWKKMKTKKITEDIYQWILSQPMDIYQWIGLKLNWQLNDFGFCQYLISNRYKKLCKKPIFINRNKLFYILLFQLKKKKPTTIYIFIQSGFKKFNCNLWSQMIGKKKNEHTHTLHLKRLVLLMTNITAF